MSLSWSQGIRDFLGMYGHYKQALEGGIIELRTGSAPTTANSAVTGTLLCTLSKASGTVGKEVLSRCKITFGGSGGSIDAVTVDGEDILGGAVSYDTSLAVTSVAVAAKINSYNPPAGKKYRAVGTNGILYLEALPGSGTSPNGRDTTCTPTTMTCSATSGFGTDCQICRCVVRGQCGNRRCGLFQNSWISQ